MVGEIRFGGAAELRALAQRLEAAGHGEIVHRMNAKVTNVLKATEPSIRASALSRLPARNGLAAKVANAPIQVLSKVTLSTMNATLRQQAPLSLPSFDRGYDRHPVFGNREKWVTQRITPGYWTVPTQAARMAVERAGQEAVNELAEGI